MVIHLILNFSDQWLAKLHKDTKRSQRSAFASGTVKNLKCQWSKFAKFCQLSGDDTMPVSTDRLCLYIQFLSRTLRSPQSIKNYVSGLKTLHLMLDLSFPSLSSLDVKLTIKGVEKSLKHVPFQATPVTPELLTQISRVLNLQDPVDIVFWCLFLFLFFLFSRKSQFLPDSLNKVDLFKIVCRRDVKYRDNMLYVTFRWTKTIQASGRVLIIPLAPISGSVLCPVSAYLNMIAEIPTKPSSPAFVLPGSLNPVTYDKFQRVFKHIVSLLGLDQSAFSSHSFRRGGASFAFRVGVPPDLIKVQGDWASDAYRLYVQIGLPQRIQVAKYMAQALL